MENYNNGHVVDVSKISVSDFEKAAKEWSEGSKTLEELLLYCLKNNIITQACCIGHKDTDMAFLQFELSERNKKAIIKIINRYYNLKDIDFLKVGHHGSNTSSSKEFIYSVNPKYSLISVGKNNRYEHPNKEVLNVLENSKIYRTDQDGSIVFKIKNNKLKIETCTP